MIGLVSLALALLGIAWYLDELGDAVTQRLGLATCVISLVSLAFALHGALA